MDDWQILYIDQNLPTLIENTRCTTVLKSWLRKAGLISSEENEILSALGNNHGRHRETAELYEILKTRKEGYQFLMEALKETRQTGAIQILQEGKNQENVDVTEKDRANQIQQLLEIQVKLSGNVKRLREVFPLLQDSEALELLRCKDIRNEIREFSKNQTVLKLQGSLPEIDPLYISRSISNRMLLQPQIFTRNCKDVFVFKGMRRNDLIPLVAPYATRSSTSQRSIITARHIHLDDEEDWDDLVRVTKQPIHLICKEDGKYVVQRSTQVTGILRDFCLNECRNRSAYISEHQFVSQLISDKDERGALVTDDPGMGKTWLMQSLSSRLQHMAPKTAVFFIELSALASHFVGGTRDFPGMKEALFLALKFACGTSLAAKILSQHSEKNDMFILLILDGFDEILEVNVETTTAYLKLLLKNENIRFILSSRPHMRTYLETTFNLVSYDILPFERQDQILAMVGVWQKSIPEGNESTLTECAIKCIESFKVIKREQKCDILGGPLLCYLLAIANLSHVGQVCNPNRKKDFEVEELSRVQSIFELYERFFDDLIVRRLEKNGLNKISNTFRRSILQFLTHQALKLLFPEIATVYFPMVTNEKSLQDAVIKMGVLCPNSLSKLEFIHRSFAEYFVGKFFGEFWMNIESFDSAFAYTVGAFFIKNVLKITNTTVPATDLDENSMMRFGKFNKSDISYDMLIYIQFFVTKYATFRWLTVLFFMNSSCYNRLDRPEYAQIFKEAANFNKPNLQRLHYESKEHIRKFSNITFMACIQQGLSSLTSLLALLIRSFFDEKERPSLFGPSEHNTEPVDTVPVMLCWLAARGSPENGSDLFGVFGNYLLEYCKNYPEKFCTPLEIAIMRNDLDMVIFFHEKIKVNLNRQFALLVTLFDNLTESQIDAKALIIKKLFGSQDKFLWYLQKYLFLTDIDYLQHVILRIIAWKFKFSLKFAAYGNRRKLLRAGLMENRDNEIIQTLLLLFPKEEYEYISIPESLTHLSSGNLASTNAKTVLELLDLRDCRDLFPRLAFNLGFVKMQSVETLKILIGICPSFVNCSTGKNNYMHYAVFNGNIDWVGYLIKAGYDINEPNIKGNTPLHLISFKRLIEITQMMIVNGANIFALTDGKRNVAHHVVKNAIDENFDDLSEWVKFMLEKGYGELWKMEDEERITPVNLLSDKLEAKKPLQRELLQLLRKYGIKNC